MGDDTIPRVVGQRGAVRVATIDDAGAIQAIYAPYVAETAISFEVDPPSTAEMASRVERAGSIYPWLVYELEGEVLGYAHSSRHKERAAYGWSVDTGVYVAQGKHRRGLGRALYTKLLQILTLQGFHYAYAGITQPNAGSVGLHEACGYRPIGVYPEVGYKLGAWHGVGWWGRPLTPPTSDPSPPRPFDRDMVGD